MVSKDDMFIYFYCFLYAYNIISPVPHHVLYISIVLVLLCILLPPPSFYHSLGRFLTTLGLRAQIGEPRIVVSGSAMESRRSFLIGTSHRYLEHLFLLSSLFPFIISVMSSDPLLQVFLYLSHAGPQVFMEVGLTYA